MKKHTLIIVLSLCWFLTLHAQIISTFAGNGTLGFSGDGGLATSAELQGVNGVCTNNSGDIIFADGDRVREINTAGIITTIAGTGASAYNGDGFMATGANITPVGVFMDGAGNLYIGDTFNNRVRKVNTNGIISTIAGNGAAGFTGDGGQATAAEIYCPEGITLDPNGNIYFIDFDNCRIRMINTSGIISTIAGTGTNGYNGDGIAATDAEIARPSGITSDNTGNIYIADSYNNMIRMINTSGIITRVAGIGSAGYSGDGGPATTAYLYFPTGVRISSTGEMFIADYNNNVVRKVNYAGIMSTVAGNGTSGYSGDGGPAISAELDRPTDICLDAQYNLYITDHLNFRIRKVQGLTAVNEIAPTAKINIFPNPSAGVFYINCVVSGSADIKVYNSFGEEIYSSQQEQGNTLKLDLSEKQAGIYFVKIVSGNHSYLGKLLKQL